MNEMERAAVENLHVIDFHAHIYPQKIAAKASQNVGHFYGISIAHDGTVESLLESGKSAGITHFMVQSVATRADQVSGINCFIASVCKADPEHFVGYGTLHPALEKPDEAICQIEALGLKGVKLHPDFQEFKIDDPVMYPIYEMLEGRLPILFHTGDYRYEYSHPRRLAKVLKRFPKLQTVAAHFGGWSVWKDGEQYLADTACMIDTSSTLPFIDNKEAERLIHVFGAERVLFGTDFPMWDHVKEWERFFALDLSETERKQICHDNACRLLEVSW